MTDEQLEKQISKEFEKWIKGMDFHCQWEADNHLISLDAYFNYVADVAFKAAALPLMKKIEEIQKDKDQLHTSYQKCIVSLENKEIENEKLKKENELLQSWVKHHQKSVELKFAEVAKLQKENEELNQYKEMWQSIAGKANLQNLVKENEELRDALGNSKIIKHDGHSFIVSESAVKQDRPTVGFYFDDLNNLQRISNTSMYADIIRFNLDKEGGK